MFIGIDTLLFAVLCQLKYYPDLYAGYVPLAYSDYLRNMSKYVHISHYAMLFLIMWLYFMSFVFTASFLCGCTRSGEWGDHVTLQAAADWV